jgi:hypothetical protein
VQKERLAYGAAAVVFDCGAASQVEYEMLFTLPDLALAVRKNALLSRFYDAQTINSPRQARDKPRKS